MALKYSIEATKRPEGSKPNALRRDGKIPATVYGHNGTESVQVLVNAKEAEFLVRDAGQGATVELRVPEMSWVTAAKIQEVQKHPWKGNLYHLSFLSSKG
ncbi:MAG: 50S ribosomal protein L25 [Synechococcales bacterium]|nr:50S ribosomal protein L25 [Synechococcales bacterium]